MFAFPSMLFPAADRAGMPRPPAEWNQEWTKELREMYPHFAVFCNVQLNRATCPGEHFANAEIIASIPNDKIRVLTVTDLVELGITF